MQKRIFVVIMICSLLLTACGHASYETLPPMEPAQTGKELDPEPNPPLYPTGYYDDDGCEIYASYNDMEDHILETYWIGYSDGFNGREDVNDSGSALPEEYSYEIYMMGYYDGNYDLMNDLEEQTSSRITQYLADLKYSISVEPTSAIIAVGEATTFEISHNCKGASVFSSAPFFDSETGRYSIGYEYEDYSATFTVIGDTVGESYIEFWYYPNPKNKEVVIKAAVNLIITE